MRLITTNLADTGALTASSEATDFPKENVQHPFKGKVWRSAAVASEWLKWDLGAARQVTGIAIVNHNATASATYTFEGHSSDSWGAPTVSESITAAPSAIMIKYFTGGTLRWWRLAMSNTSLSYISAGRIFFGAYFQPGVTPRIEWGDRLVDPSKISSAIGGQLHTDLKTKRRELSAELSYLSLADKNSLLTILDAVGVGKDFIFSIDEVNHLADLSFYGRLTGMPAFAHQFGEKYNMAISFMEAV